METFRIENLSSNLLWHQIIHVVVSTPSLSLILLTPIIACGHLGQLLLRVGN